MQHSTQTTERITNNSPPCSGRDDPSFLLTVRMKMKNQDPTNPPRMVWSRPAARSALNICMTLNVRTARRRAIPADVLLGRAGEEGGKEVQ